MCARMRICMWVHMHMYTCAYIYAYIYIYVRMRNKEVEAPGHGRRGRYRARGGVWEPGFPRYLGLIDFTTPGRRPCSYCTSNRSYAPTHLRMCMFKIDPRYMRRPSGVWAACVCVLCVCYVARNNIIGKHASSNLKTSGKS